MTMNASDHMTLRSCMFNVACSMFVFLLAILTGPPARAASIVVPEERVQTIKLSPEAEKAIKRGLAYLKYTQTKDGSWGGQYKITGASLATGSGAPADCAASSFCV